MIAREKKFTVKRIYENTKNGNIVYDHPMQRKAGQWNKEQKSLLIHSILAGYAIPQTYALQLDSNFDEAFSVLDGKQRCTTICEYLSDGFALDKKTPDVTIKKREIVTDEDGNRTARFVNTDYEIAKKKFSELDESLRDRILEFNMNVIILSDCSDEDIEDQFYRLNNGTPLTTDQKTRVVLGDALAAFIDEQESKKLFTNKSNYSNNQRVKGAVQRCILQILMLVLDYPYTNIGSASVKKFAEWLRENYGKNDLEYCSDIIDKLDEAIPVYEKPNKNMNSTNIPIFAYHVQTADAIGMSMADYGKCIQDLLNDAFRTDGTLNPECEYAEKYCGSHSYDKEKVTGRLNYFEHYMKSWKEMN